MRRTVVVTVLLLLMTCALAGASWAQAGGKLPRMIDFGSTTCIPCKQMEPILKELKTELAGVVEIEFVNVNEKPALAETFEIEVIPTQVFISAEGQELSRHVGFMGKSAILARWRSHGVKVPIPAPQSFSRWTPAQTDQRPRELKCQMCERDNNPKTRVVVRSPKGEVYFCSPHSFFIFYTSLTADRAEMERQAFVTDWKTGQLVPIKSAHYLQIFNEQSGKPFTMAFGTREAALTARRHVGGSILTYELLKGKELATRCGFCDRAVYPEDAALVLAGGLYTWGCCSHCALGVAARMQTDLVVHERDRLTGEPIVVTIASGQIAALDPPTAVAWYGQRLRPDGTKASAGCFHQGFFVSPETLKQWVANNPLETGELITIEKALADKMVLSPEQISKACKIGECAPQ